MVGTIGSKGCISLALCVVSPSLLLTHSYTLTVPNLLSSPSTFDQPCSRNLGTLTSHIACLPSVVSNSSSGSGDHSRVCFPSKDANEDVGCVSFCFPLPAPLNGVPPLECMSSTGSTSSSNADMVVGSRQAACRGETRRASERDRTCT
jgi:hypothetical protein